MFKSKNDDFKKLFNFRNQAIYLLVGIVIGFFLCSLFNQSKKDQNNNKTKEFISSKKERFIPVEGPFILHYDGYSTCYDGRTKNPIWVHEHLTKESLYGPAKRSNNFKEDSYLPSHLRSTLVDYRRSGFDRGHLSAAGNLKISQQASDETFILSNISPQVGKGFNRKGY